MLKDIDAVLFDLDGTLVDSMWMWCQIDLEYLARFGLEMPEDLQKEIGGISVTETARYFQNRFGITDSVEKMISDWNDMAYEKYQNHVPLKPGAGAFLEVLREKKIRCAIATSNTNVLTEVVLNALGIKDYFEVILTGEAIKVGKPAPDVYLECARRLGVRPERCLVFEDIVEGIMAGKAAGMTVYAIEDDFSKYKLGDKEELADYLIKDFTELDCVVE